VACLTDELVRRGHEVTLFASGDSRTAATLVPVVERAMRYGSDTRDLLAVAFTRELGMVFSRATDFDVIHCHVDYLAFPFGALTRTPTVHTIHGRLDLPHLVPLYQQFSTVPLVSISMAQRAPLEPLGVRWAATVYHGLPTERLAFALRIGGISRSWDGCRPRSSPTWPSRSPGAWGCRSRSPPRSTPSTASTSTAR